MSKNSLSEFKITAYKDKNFLFPLAFSFRQNKFQIKYLNADWKIFQREDLSCNSKFSVYNESLFI